MNDHSSHPAVWNNQTVRDLERETIREFVKSCSDHLTGRVLDYGCGKQPYRGIVEDAGGEYHGYDWTGFPGNVSGEDLVLPKGGFDAILVTQVLQYVPVYAEMTEADYYEFDQTLPLLYLLDEWRDRLRSRSKLRRSSRPGHLILSYGTNWDEVEPTDLCRWTKSGIDWLLDLAGFTVLRHERRAEINLGGFRFPLGGGVVARA